METLKKHRQEIDDLDRIIIEALDQRFDKSIEIGDYKNKEGIAVADSGRENEIYKKINRSKFPENIKNVFKTIIEESKSLQKKD